MLKFSNINGKRLRDRHLPFFLRSFCAFHLQNKTSKTGNMFPKFEGAVTTILLREFPPILLGKIIHQIMVFPLLFSATLPIFAPSKS